MVRNVNKYLIQNSKYVYCVCITCIELAVYTVHTYSVRAVERVEECRETLWNGFFVFALFLYLSIYLLNGWMCMRPEEKHEKKLEVEFISMLILLHPLASLLFAFTFRNLFVMRKRKAYVEYAFDCWTLHQGTEWAINKTKEWLCYQRMCCSFILCFQHFKRNEIITMWFECALLHTVHVSVNQYRSKIV